MSEQHIAIRLAVAADAKALGALIRALDTHYRGEALAPPADAASVMVSDCVDRAEGTRFALVLVDDVPAGFAAFAVLRPGRSLKGLLYAKEIFVADAYRGQGLGTALFQFLECEARRLGLGRIELTTDPENKAAQRFYERLGGERTEKVAYRFWQPG